MKSDHDGSLRKVADFIGVRPTDEEWRAITEYTSFSWMKEHGIKFDATTATETPVLKPGAMVRKGKSGAAGEDGMTPTIAEHRRALGSTLCPNDAALRWFYEGGPLPD